MLIKRAKWVFIRNTLVYPQTRASHSPDLRPWVKELQPRAQWTQSVYVYGTNNLDEAAVGTLFGRTGRYLSIDLCKY